MLDRTIRTIVTETAVDRVVIAANHLSDQLASYLAAMPGYGVPVDLIKVSGNSTGGSVRECAEELSDPFIYSHCNIRLRPGALSAVVEAAYESGIDGAIGVSARSVAPTHPHVLVSEDDVLGFIDGYGEAAMCSVGAGCFRRAIVGDISDAGASRPFELALDTGRRRFRSIDIGTDWLHLEDLGFYRDVGMLANADVDDG